MKIDELIEALEAKCETLRSRVVELEALLPVLFRYGSFWFMNGTGSHYFCPDCGQSIATSTDPEQIRHLRECRLGKALRIYKKLEEEP